MVQGHKVGPQVEIVGISNLETGTVHNLEVGFAQTVFLSIINQLFKDKVPQGRIHKKP